MNRVRWMRVAVIVPSIVIVIAILYFMERHFQVENVSLISKSSTIILTKSTLVKEELLVMYGHKDNKNKTG